MKEKPNGVLSEGFGIMPNKVLLDKKLSSTSKLLYVLISSLSASNGYCFATNKYLAEKLGISETQVSVSLSKLKNYLRFESRKSYKRKIYLSELNENMVKGVDKQNQPLRKLKGTFKKTLGNLKENLKHNNIIEYNKYNIYSKNKKIKKSKYTFRGNPCRIDNFTGKWKCFENGEWLEIAEGYEKEIKVK